LKVYQVDFEYTEKASVYNVVANSADEAVAGAQKLVASKVKNPSGFTATEITKHSEDFDGAPTLN